MRAWMGLGALVLGAASFGLGYWSVSPGTGKGPSSLDIDESRERIHRAMLSAQRLEQVRLVVPVLQAMTPADAPQLAEVFEENFARGGGGMPLELFIERWASSDLEACRDRIASWPPDARAQAWPTLLEVWARSDPSEARAALDEIPDPRVRRRAQAPLLIGWVEADDPGVWSGLADVENDDLQRELLSFAVRRRLHAKGAESLLAELEKLPDQERLGSLKGMALATALQTLAQRDLSAAVSLAKPYRETDQAGEVLFRIGPLWAARDGRAAIDWIAGAAAGDPRNRALVRTYRRWLHLEPDAATHWLEASAVDSDAGLLAPAHAGVLAIRDPKAAIDWASALPEAEVRRRALQAALRVWRETDAQAAETWLEGAESAEAIDDGSPGRVTD